jgi:membrane protease YdiL (CAAX protease family)
MTTLLRRFPLASYFLLAYLLSWSLEIPLALSARGALDWSLPHSLEVVAAFGPFAAAIIVLSFTQGRAGCRQLFASLLHWRVPVIWWLAAVLSPFVIMLAALEVTGETGRLAAGDFWQQLLSSGKLAELIFIGGILRGFGEEPGWRGFALPVLRGRYGPLLATFALWPVWLLWHLPAFLLRPEFELAAGIGFSVGILSAAAWCTLLYDQTRSLLLLALWHALINITRGVALAVSSAAFMAFSQIMLVVGLLVIIYWLVRRPGKYQQQTP